MDRSLWPLTNLRIFMTCPPKALVWIGPCIHYSCGCDILRAENGPLLSPLRPPPPPSLLSPTPTHTAPQALPPPPPSYAFLPTWAAVRVKVTWWCLWPTTSEYGGLRSLSATALSQQLGCWIVRIWPNSVQPHHHHYHHHYSVYQQHMHRSNANDETKHLKWKAFLEDDE